MELFDCMQIGIFIVRVVIDLEWFHGAPLCTYTNDQLMELPSSMAGNLPP